MATVGVGRLVIVVQEGITLIPADINGKHTHTHIGKGGNTGKVNRM